MSFIKSSSRTLILTVTIIAVFFTMGALGNEVDAATYKVSKKKASVYVGSKVKLKVLTKKGKQTTKKVKWKSSNKKIASVSKYGNVKGKKKGKVKITAKIGKKTLKCTLTVKKPVQRINTKKVTKKAGQTVSLKMLSLKKEKVKGKYKKPKITWSSSNKKIATVSKSGKVTTKKPGKVKITAKVGKKKKKYSSTIKVKYPSYSITTKTTPIKTAFKGYSGYNSKTKNYYTIRSYLEVFEAAGGGTLTLSKGNYSITNALYVPSNVTINFANGVKVKKSASTGTSKLKPSKSIFQLCAPSKASVANGYSKGKYKSGYKGYGGVHNVNFYGRGKVVIDNSSIEDSISIIMGHNNKINIDNITFENMNYGHFIEANSSANVNVTNCIFKDGTGGNKEAINIDTPDLITNGFNSPWSSFDRTPVKNFTVRYCEFNNIPVSVGSHRYSEGRPHTNVNILNCTIKNMSNNGIYALNWKDCTIQGNEINGIVGPRSSQRGIRAGGVDNLVIRGNNFSNMPRVAQFSITSLNGFAPIQCNMSEELLNIIIRENNFGGGIGEDFIRINPFMLPDNSDFDSTKYRKFFLDGSPSQYKGYTPEGGITQTTQNSISLQKSKVELPEVEPTPSVDEPENTPTEQAINSESAIKNQQ